MSLKEMIDRSSSSVSLSFDKPEEEMYNVTCMSSSSNIPRHIVTLFDFSTNHSEAIKVKPLVPSTDYICCLEYNRTVIGNCSNATTSSEPLSLAEAGAIGGIVGVVVTLLIIAGITSMAFGIAILYRRKK